MKEPLANIGRVCAAHASKPDPALHEFPMPHYVGRFVKIAFIERVAPHRLEHMWVRVTGTRPRRHLVGVLDNDPVYDVGYACGDTVTFAVRAIERLDA